MGRLPLMLLLAAPAWSQCEVQEVHQTGGALIDYFGDAVAVDGGRLAVGVPYRTSVGFRSGSVVTFEWDAVLDTWIETGELIGSNLEVHWRMGDNLALDGDWLAVGVPNGRLNSGYTGIVYVYRHDGANWVETQILDRPWPFSATVFGNRVQISGDTMAVGASGALFIYRLDPVLQIWQLEQEITCDDCQTHHDVSLDGDRLVIADPFAKGPVLLSRGLAYVYERDPVTGVWSLDQTLIGPHGYDAVYGWTSAIHGDVIAVTSWYNTVDGFRSGAVYLYEHGPNGWEVLQFLGHPALTTNIRYGFDVALDDKTLVVGADIEARAYVYEREGTGQFRLNRVVEGPAVGATYFGGAVDVDDRWLAVGDFHGDGEINDSGTAWMFDLDTCSRIGTSFCGPAAVNSTGKPARIEGAGVAEAGGEPLLCVGTDLPTSQPSMLLVSQSVGSATPPGSQGTLCLSGQIGRFTAQIQDSGILGQVEVAVDTTALPVTPQAAVQPGETWRFQLWYRDANPQATSNFSDGVAIQFQ